MSSESPRTGRNQVAAIEELYGDIARIEAGESVHAIAEQWDATQKFMDDKSALHTSTVENNGHARRNLLALAITKILRRGV